MKNDMNEIIKICDKISSYSKCPMSNSNPIVCAKNILRLHINGDKNNYLKLKAQLEYYYNFEEAQLSNIALNVSVASLAISSIIGSASLTATYLKTETFISLSKSIMEMLILILLIVSIFFLTPRMFNKCTWRRKRWLTYIKYALEGMENEFK